jgi:hypothetical protein
MPRKSVQSSAEAVIGYDDHRKLVTTVITHTAKPFGDAKR